MDFRILFTTRIVRLSCYGFLSLILALYLANPVLFSLPFFLCGALKLVYDMALYRSFRKIKAPEGN